MSRPDLADEESLVRLYEEHVDGLYVFVLYRVGNDATIAEDVVHDTFLHALDRLSDYDPKRGTIRNWLITLSRNVIRKHLAGRPRNTEDVGLVWDRIDRALLEVFQALDESPLTDEVLARRETQELVNMTIANLPDPYSAVLHRKYVGGESLADLARHLSVSEDAAKSLLARARRAFRDTFLTLSEAKS
jgi:RNA polymerase sigma-70 factor (ECF subfamily)